MRRANVAAGLRAVAGGKWALCSLTALVLTAACDNPGPPVSPTRNVAITVYCDGRFAIIDEALRDLSQIQRTDGAGVEKFFRDAALGRLDDPFRSGTVVAGNTRFDIAPVHCAAAITSYTAVAQSKDASSGDDVETITLSLRCNPSIVGPTTTTIISQTGDSVSPNTVTCPAGDGSTIAVIRTIPSTNRDLFLPIATFDLSMSDVQGSCTIFVPNSLNTTPR